MSDDNNSQSQNKSINAIANNTCPYCQRRFTSMDQLTLHVVTRHTWNGKAKPSEPAVSGKS